VISKTQGSGISPLARYGELPGELPGELFSLPLAMASSLESSSPFARYGELTGEQRRFQLAMARYGEQVMNGLG
jgi:hypothetical protein